MPTTISLQHVTKTYQPTGHQASLEENDPNQSEQNLLVALDDLSLTTRPGEILGILGPSGCGKTTLLRLAAGLEQPDSGTVLYDQENLNDIPMGDRGIGMVFQNYALYPHLPSVDNIGFFLRLRKRDTEIPERVRDISQIMKIDLGPILGRKPPTLSGGEKQRVAIARCLARDPRVFFFDEPFSNLDAKFRSDARVELKRLLQKYDVTSIYVTHDQQEAIALCHRIAILHHGKLMQIGTHKHLYETPKNTFVAGFLGNPPMNLFPGHVQDHIWRGQTFDWGPVRSDIDDGTRIVLGIRPEHFTANQGGGISAAVELVDVLYGERVKLVYVKIGSQAAVVRLPQHQPVTIGQQLPLGIKPEQVHLFDQQSGQRIG